MTAVAPHITSDMSELKPMEEEGQQTTDPDMGSKPAVLELKDGGEIQEESPPLTYIDFLPQCLGSRLEGCEPTYAEFQSVVEQANQWLCSMPQFGVVKCETVDHKVNPTDFSLDSDATLQHFSSHGKNVYLRGLRLWLMPKTDDTVPTQQLAYITVMPEHCSGNLTSVLSRIKPSAMRINPEQLFHDFDDLATTVEKLNHHLQQKPLPGRILTVETLKVKAMETDRPDQPDTEATLWSENGKASRLFLHATRIFYVVGQPAFETVGFYDEIPDCAQNPEGLGLRVKFAPFTQTVGHAAVWLSAQQNMRAVNFQSLTLKLERPGGSGIFRVNATTAGYTEAKVLQESRYVKVLRIFYVKDERAEAPALYNSVQLTTRLFVPTKGYGRAFDSFSKTVQRLISWLNATGTPVLAMETVKYPVNPDSESGVNRERVDCVVNSHSGHHDLTCVRLFFPCQFKEPPPELVPETAEDAEGWGCVLS
ncbi:uncharacterized protein LOC143290015 [Babylonia areolata]|uniref:uncharacterized protein LOC143290015 n=1 Tax=Babylonia areolata TaxID=304850 RepID=UPI003FD07150